jgi:hypothetical protein
MVALLALQGCCLTPGFVTTQRDFFDAIKGEYRTYVENDAGLSDTKKRNRYDLLDAQEAVLREAEASQ